MTNSIICVAEFDSATFTATSAETAAAGATSPMATSAMETTSATSTMATVTSTLSVVTTAHLLAVGSSSAIPFTAGITVGFQSTEETTIEGETSPTTIYVQEITTPPGIGPFRAIACLYYSTSPCALSMLPT